jgi:DNA invertase Pin-like site-specific DNA recombinase
MGKCDNEINAAVYCRVSTLLGQDPNNQLIPIREFVKNRGFTLIEEFVDKGISGAKERRPALDKLIAQARQGKFKIVIVAAIDRIGRNTRHLLNLIAELNDYGVSIISIRESLDFTTSVGRATLGILAIVSELERDILKERIRTSMAAKKLAAQQSGTTWACGRPTIQSEQLTNRVQELRAKGQSIRIIAKELAISKSSVQRVIRGYSKGSKSEPSQHIEITSSEPKPNRSDSR